MPLSSWQIGHFLGRIRNLLGSIGIIVSHFSSWLGLPMERGRQGDGVGVSHGTFKLPCCQFLVSKEKLRPGRVGEIKRKIITQVLV